MNTSALAALCMAVLMTWLLCGCAVTTNYQGGEKVSRTVSLGIPPRLPRIESGRIEQTAFGVGIARSYGGVGYIRTELAILPRDCGAIILTEDPEQVAGILDLSHLCEGTEHETHPGNSPDTGGRRGPVGLHRR